MFFIDVTLVKHFILFCTDMFILRNNVSMTTGIITVRGRKTIRIRYNVNFPYSKNIELLTVDCEFTLNIFLYNAVYLFPNSLILLFYYLQTKLIFLE